MKKFITYILLLAILVTNFNLNTAVYANSNEVQVKVNGKLIEFDVKPLINEDNRTLVPVRFIAENLGANVSWNQELKQVTIEKESTIIKLIIGEKKATVNDEIVEFDTKAILKNGRTLVPVRFISETLGVNIGWNDETKAVIITTNLEEFKVDKNDINKEFEEFIVSKEASKYASTHFFTAKDGKIIFKDGGKFTHYGEITKVDDSEFKNINELAYKLISTLTLEAKKHDLYLEAYYNDLFNGSIQIKFLERKGLKHPNFSVSLYPNGLAEEMYVFLEIGAFTGDKDMHELGYEGLKEKKFQLDKYTIAYKKALEILYDKKIGKKIYNYTVNEYQKSFIEQDGSKRINLSTVEFGDIKLKNWNDTGNKFRFSTNY